MSHTHSSPLVHQTLGSLVAADGRAALVLERFGLDFCCGGRRTLEVAARARGVRVDDVVQSLSALGAPSDEDREPATWQDLDVLVHHILDQHHTYIRRTSPTIHSWLDRLVERHGERHPELADIADVFDALIGELTTHMLKEEHILFPAITELTAAHRNRGLRPATPFGTIGNPVRVMEADHDGAAELMMRLRILTSDFSPPPDGCTTYRLCFEELARFERNLHRHVHLENNVLFPRAIALEQALG